MKKIVRNMSTPECRAFWADIEKSSAEVRQWPDWKRAGINVSQFRTKQGIEAPTSKPDDE